MYRDLIIGYDGSDAGRDALALGRRLALATGARATVVFARSYAALMADVQDSGEDLAWNEAAHRILDEARDTLSDVPDVAYHAVAERSAAHALHSVAETAEAAVLVLGSTHRSGLARIAPGTTADQILHAAPCAVAVAPAGYAERAGARPIGLVGAAVDGGDESARVARLAANVARRAEATLRLITVVEHLSTAGPMHTGGLGFAGLADALRDVATQTLERAAAAAGDGLRIERRVFEGDPAAELITQSADLDLLVIGSRGFGPLRRIVPGSAGAKILRAAVCPVLVLPRATPEELDEALAALAGAGADPAPLRG